MGERWEQVRKLVESLSIRQKVAIGAAVLAVLAGLSLFIRYQREQGYAVLYSNLATEDASAVVAKLKESAIEYRLSSDGKTIRVKSDKIADLRLEMAAAGIPKTGRIGFELFDRNNFGLTEFAEQVNYHRALEGELERTVMHLAEVEHARIHVTPPKDSVFAENRREAKASVLLKLRPSRELSKSNIKAITHMVSNAVEGLKPEQVTILDVHGNLLTIKESEEEQAKRLNETLMEYRRSLERDLLAKVTSTLEPLLGPNRFRAAVSVDVDYSTSDLNDEVYDPGRSVMTSSERSEEVIAQSQPAGVPGAPTVLPRPAFRPGAGGTGPGTRRSESIKYESSKSVKRTHVPQGTIRRISASVLLDHWVRTEGTGAQMRRVVEPPPPERLKAARDLVAAAVGLDASRGDQVVVESIAFDQTSVLAGQPVAQPAKPAPSGAVERYVEAVKSKDLVAISLTAAVFLFLGALAAFLLLRKKKRPSATVVDTPAVGGTAPQPELEARGAPPALDDSGAEPGSLPAPAEGDDTADILAGMLSGDGGEFSAKFGKHMAAQLEEQRKKAREQEDQILSSLNLKVPTASPATKKAEVLTKHVIEHAKRDPEALTQVIRTWVNRD